MPQIEVTFDIDANGIVNVSAKDLGTNKEQKITITASSGLSKDEIDRMTKDAQSHADEDKNYREKVEAKNKLDNLVYNTEKLLNENREKIPESDATSLEAALAKSRQTLEGSPEVAELTAAFDELTRASHKLAEVMYQKTATQGGPGPGAGAPAGEPQAGKSKPEEEVIDAEYVDVDENKR